MPSEAQTYLQDSGLVEAFESRPLHRPPLTMQCIPPFPSLLRTIVPDASPFPIARPVFLELLYRGGAEALGGGSSGGSGERLYLEAEAFLAALGEEQRASGPDAARRTLRRVASSKTNLAEEEDGLAEDGKEEMTTRRVVNERLPRQAEVCFASLIPLLCLPLPCR